VLLVDSVRRLTLSLTASVVLGTAALVFARSASANLPQQPYCGSALYPLIASAFGVRPTSWTPGGGDAPEPIVCDYNVRAKGASGKPRKKTVVEIEFDTGWGRSGFESYLSWYRKYKPPVRLVRGIGNAAFVASSGQELVFLDGADVVLIGDYSKPLARLGPKDAAAIEAFAKKIIPLM